MPSYEFTEKLKIMENRISNFETKFNKKIDSIKNYMEGTTSCLKDHDIKLASNISVLDDVKSITSQLEHNLENYKHEYTPYH